MTLDLCQPKASNNICEMRRRRAQEKYYALTEEKVLHETTAPSLSISKRRRLDRNWETSAGLWLNGGDIIIAQEFYPIVKNPHLRTAIIDIAAIYFSLFNETRHLQLFERKPNLNRHQWQHQINIRGDDIEYDLAWHTHKSFLELQKIELIGRSNANSENCKSALLTPNAAEYVLGQIVRYSLKIFRSSLKLNDTIILQVPNNDEWNRSTSQWLARKPEEKGYNRSRPRSIPLQP